MTNATARRSIQTERPIRVLVVDDSAVAREVLTLVLRRGGFDVITAPNADVATLRIGQMHPDVIVLDLELPGRSGLEFLEHLMRTQPLPVVVCSGIAQRGTASAIRALELGALEVLPKPALGIRALLGSTDIALDDVIRAAAGSKSQLAATRTPVLHITERSAKPMVVGLTPWSGKVVAVGSSTGGTEALRAILSKLPADAPPMIIVQHMPGAFTGAFARRLNAFAKLQVREAKDGDVLRTGLALVAPGGRQLELTLLAGEVRVRIYDGPTVSGHRPSVDTLFQSAARVLGARAVGVLLTGMGADGAEGMLRMREQGAHTIAQDEATCVVYGMPREAVELGAVQRVLPLDGIAAGILEAASARTDVAAD
jgi:two-component system, chemotaxis family, protein-glutamate methylesterase/glutaminase